MGRVKKILVCNTKLDGSSSMHKTFAWKELLQVRQGRLEIEPQALCPPGLPWFWAKRQVIEPWLAWFQQALKGKVWSLTINHECQTQSAKVLAMESNGLAPNNKSSSALD